MAVPSSWISWIDETLIAPEATPSERLLGYGSGVFGAIFAGALAMHAELPVGTVIVLAVMGFDVFGGVVVNATRSGSRRFHGPATSRWSGLGFVACHVHPLVVALLVPDEMPWPTAIVAYGGIMLTAVLIIRAPSPLRQPVAFASAAILIAVATAMPPLVTVIGWVLPLLIVKLLLSHLLPHPPST